MKNKKTFYPDRIGSYFRVEWLSLTLVTLSGVLYNVGLLAAPCGATSGSRRFRRSTLPHRAQAYCSSCGSAPKTSSERGGTHGILRRLRPFFPALQS